MKKVVSLIVFSSLSFLLNGHEFWLQPKHFIIRPGESVGIQFHMGENFTGENWQGNKSSAEQLKLFYKDVDDDLKNLLGDSTMGDSLKLQFFDEGTVMIAFQSSNQFIEIAADTFMAFLKKDGLQNAIDYRTEKGLTDSTGREFYQCNIKTIFQVGSVKDSAYKRKSGLPLDIIPLSHPYALQKGQKLPVQVFFRDSLLVNTMVRVWHKNSGKTEVSTLFTDEAGRLQVPVSLTGEWMISLVKMEQLSDSSGADWQSYWGSLTWGYK